MINGLQNSSGGSTGTAGEVGESRNAEGRHWQAIRKGYDRRLQPRRKRRPKPQARVSAPVSAVYLVVEDDGAVVAVFEVLEVVLAGVLAGADEGEKLE